MAVTDPGRFVQRPDLAPTTAPTPAGTPGLIPIQYSTQIIQMAQEQSLAMRYFRNVRMPNAATVMPVLDALPVARWVTGELTDPAGTGQGKKNVTGQKWKGINLIAEELATIVVIPEAVIEDASIDLWAEITPRIAEAVAAAFDGAVFAGIQIPTSWNMSGGLIAAATTAGNVTTAAAAVPTQDEYDEAIALVEADGFMPTDVFAGVSQRSAFRTWAVSGVPVYLTDYRDDGRVDSVFGMPVHYDRLNAFNVGSTKTVAMVADPDKGIVGTRTDLQYKVLTEATIDVSAAQDGSEMVSLAQQDLVALRVRGRFAFATANPVTYLNKDGANRFPFSVIKTP